VTPPGEDIAHLGFDANRGTVMSGELSKYRIVHFATHGILNESRPEFSGLMLSMVDERGHSRLGFVVIEDISYSENTRRVRARNDAPAAA
jgi:CHAT domain-containing protein